MRRATFVLLGSMLAACGSATDSGGTSSPFKVTVVADSRTGGSGADWIDAITFEVTDKATSAVISGATVITQVSAGAVTTLPLVTAANGRVTGFWTIEPADQGAAVRHALAFCAPPLGSSLCKTTLGASDNVTVTF